MSKDILIGIDAGTSVVKSVAFDCSGNQLASASVTNKYTVLADGTATQPLDQTWADCATTLRNLGEKVPDLAARTVALAVTAQGDGTWLVGKGDRPVGDGWLWLDSRAVPALQRLCAKDEEQVRFETTGTGLNACQQGVQLAFMQSNMPKLLAEAETALHCKDWLYLNLTGERVTDPSEACFTFGNYQTRQYDDNVIDMLGLTTKRNLLPPIIDGTKTTHPLTATAASRTGLLPGTPVSLAFVDVVCTAMGAGIYTKDVNAGCTIIGTTGMHMRAVSAQNVHLNAARTGYVMVLPVPTMVGQMQSNMAATLNIDWLLKTIADLLVDLGTPVTQAELLAHVDRWVETSKAGTMLYHPYISAAGERGPFANHTARAGFIGLTSTHRFADLLRAVIEGLGMSARDCYEAIGDLPAEVRLSGGAAKSATLRGIFAATMNIPVRCSSRDEAGAAGAAMTAAVAIGAYDSMTDCVEKWVTPLLNALEPPDPKLAHIYHKLFAEYVAARHALQPIWGGIAQLQRRSDD